MYIYRPDRGSGNYIVTIKYDELFNYDKDVTRNSCTSGEAQLVRRAAARSINIV